MPPLETLPPGNPSGGLFYLRIVLSLEETSRPWVFHNRFFSRGGVVSASPNPQAGGPPLVGCPRLLIQFIRSYPSYRRPFLYPQPEDAPWRGDRDPQTQFNISLSHKITKCLKGIYLFVCRNCDVKFDRICNLICTRKTVWRNNSVRYLL